MIKPTLWWIYMHDQDMLSIWWTCLNLEPTLLYIYLFSIMNRSNVFLQIFLTNWTIIWLFLSGTNELWKYCQCYGFFKSWAGFKYSLKNASQVSMFYHDKKNKCLFYLVIFKKWKWSPHICYFHLLQILRYKGYN